MAILPAPLALAAIPAANAQIVYTNPADITADYSSGAEVYIDMGTNGGTGSVAHSNSPSVSDLRIWFQTSSRSMAPSYYSSGLKLLENVTDRARRFDLNANIAGALSSDPIAWINYNGDNDANWSNPTEGYLGVSFNAGSGVVPGWIHITYNGSSITVHDFAYNASGGPILAGQTTAVPEPSTYAAIAGLLAGSAALYRRRQQTKAAA